MLVGERRGLAVFDDLLQNRPTLLIKTSKTLTSDQEVGGSNPFRHDASGQND
jgi:hypothetical protein